MLDEGGQICGQNYNLIILGHVYRPLCGFELTLNLYKNKMKMLARGEGGGALRRLQKLSCQPFFWSKSGASHIKNSVLQSFCLSLSLLGPHIDNI